MFGNAACYQGLLRPWREETRLQVYPRLNLDTTIYPNPQGTETEASRSTVNTSSSWSFPRNRNSNEDVTTLQRGRPGQFHVQTHLDLDIVPSEGPAKLSPIAPEEEGCVPPPPLCSAVKKIRVEGSERSTTYRLAQQLQR